MKTLDTAIIRGQLHKIIDSHTFRKSGRSKELLTYLVEKTLLEPTLPLDGYSIAIDVFQKDSSFDPASNSTVRVQIGRLRNFLKAYYDVEGLNDPIVISIPKGCNRPHFSPGIEDNKAPAPSVSPPQSHPHHNFPRRKKHNAIRLRFSTVWLIGGLMLTFLAGFAIDNLHASKASARSAHSKPEIFILPVQDFSLEGRYAAAAEKIAMNINSHLAQTNRLEVKSPPNVENITSRQQLHNIYHLKSAIFADDAITSFTVTLVHPTDATILWGDTYHLSREDFSSHTALVELASTIADDITQEEGPLFQYHLTRNNLTGKTHAR